MEEEKPVDVTNSILNSTKKRVGLLPDIKEFDSDIISCINYSIATLRQLGIGPQDKTYVVDGEEQTYSDYLGEGSNETSLVKEYLANKVRLMFDPPQSSIVLEAIKAIIKETECRLSYQVDPMNTFE